MKRPEKIQNVVKLLSSLGVNIKKTKSRLDIINTLPAFCFFNQKSNFILIFCLNLRLLLCKLVL